ncbi:MAG TPA: site-specific integrase, partial [Arthrobacter sp.]|nr:site-specific integrase [Arthrobacter sp.]
MRVYKVEYRGRDGRQHEARKWYLEFKDHRSTVRRLAGFTSKPATEELGRKIQQLVSYAVATGGQTDPALAQWVNGLPQTFQAKLADIGLLDARRLAVVRPLAGHLNDFEAALRAKGTSLKQAAQVAGRARAVVTGCGFKTISDVNGAAVMTHLERLRRDTTDAKGKVLKRGLGYQTSNFHLAAIKQFFKWMVTERRAPESPVAHLAGLNVRLDRRHDRRPLSVDEVQRLLRAAYEGPDVFAVPGPMRALFYRLAVETGLRSGELRSLTRGSFEFGGSPTVTVEAAYAKNRRQDTLPLRPETAALVRAHVATLAPAAPLFRLPHPDTMIDMLRADLKAAAIPYIQDGKYADLHALRHTCGTWLAAAGVHPKVIQRVLRHSTITLTLDRYTHAFKGDEAAAIAKLPALGTSVALRATGTDGRPPAHSALARCLAEQGRPVETCGDPGGLRAGSRVTEDIRENPAKNPESSGKTPTRPAGFEPTTCGLGNR